MLSVTFSYCYAECRYAVRRYAACRCAMLGTSPSPQRPSKALSGTTLCKVLMKHVNIRLA